MPGRYGFLDYIHEEQDLSRMEVDITVGSTWETMCACSAESWRRGEYGALLLTLCMIPGCVWTDIWVDGATLTGTVKRCYGFATEDTLEHELQHCRGYADHPLFRL